MSIKPLLFNTEMVRAILEGRKSVTRRVVKMNRSRIYKAACSAGRWSETFGSEIPDEVVEWYAGEVAKPHYQSGDILWVRETFLRNECTPDCAGQADPDECVFNRVGNSCYGYKTQYIGGTGSIKWHPSIHMPKAAARLFLRVTAVRAERLQEIDNAGAKAEGVTAETDNSGKMHRSLFVRLWNSTIQPADLQRYGWAASPWVWVIEFERCERPHDFLEG